MPKTQAPEVTANLFSILFPLLIVSVFGILVGLGSKEYIWLASGPALFVGLFFRSPLKVRLSQDQLTSWSLTGKKQIMLADVNHIQARGVALFGVNMGVLNNALPDNGLPALVLRSKTGQRYLLDFSLLPRDKIWAIYPALDQLMKSSKVKKVNIVSSTWDILFPYKERVKRGLQ